MTAFHIVMITAAVLVALYGAWVLGHMVVDELRRSFTPPDPTTETWLKVSDPRRRLVPVVDKHGRYIAVRPDKTDGWE